MKLGLIYGLQIFVGVFVFSAAFDYLFRDAVDWYATCGFAALMGAALGLIHTMGWMKKK